MRAEENKWKSFGERGRVEMKWCKRERRGMEMKLWKRERRGLEIKRGKWNRHGVEMKRENRKRRREEIQCGRKRRVVEMKKRRGKTRVGDEMWKINGYRGNNIPLIFLRPWGRLVRFQKFIQISRTELEGNR